MNKSELVEVAAKEAGITKAAADKALSAILEHLDTLRKLGLG